MMLTWKVLSRSVGVAGETSQVVNKVPDVLSSKPQPYTSQAEQHESRTPALLEWEEWVETRRPMRLIGQPR